MSDVRARRWAAQGLAAPLGAGAGDVVRALLAVQAQDFRAAGLAVRARSRGLVAADVDAALEARELVLAWLLRGTLHLVASEDLPWLHALTAPTRMATSRRRLAQEGVPPADADRAVATIERALADDGPLTRAQLAERIARRGVRTEGQATPHLLMLAVLRGAAVLGPVRDGGPAFVHRETWLRGAPPPARESALAELARRYLAAHGPAASEDLAAWSGLPLRDARAGLRAIAAELIEEGGGLVDLPGRGGAPPFAPRLLGPFDPYLLGWRDRSFAVAPEHARRVHPGGGILRAVALLDGRAAGTWGARRGRGGLTVTLAPFAELPDRALESLRDEAADVARFEDLPLAGFGVEAPQVTEAAAARPPRRAR